MKRLVVALAMLAVAASAADAQAPGTRTERGQLIVEGVPVTPPAVRERLRQYVNTRGAGFSDFIGDGILISTRFADTAQMHLVAAPMGARRQLSFFSEPVSGAAVRPGRSSQIAFVKDVGGDEFFQGYLLDRATGVAAAFTEPGTRNEGFTWSRDGALMAWARTTKDSPDYDILVADPANPSSRKVIHKGKGAIQPIDFSPDGKTLLVGQYVSVAKSRRFLLDIASGALTELTPTLDVAYDGGEFTSDGRSIILISDEGSEFARLVQLDLATGARSPLAASATAEVEGFDLAPDGHRLAYVLNVDGASQVKLMDLRLRSADRSIPAPQLPAGVLTGLTFDASGARLGLSLNAATAPSDAYVWDLAARTLTRWTESEVGGLDPSRFVAPSLIRFPTFDSKRGGPKEISAWVYAPKTPGPHPVIVSIHGGPEGQSRPTFSSTVQYWVNELGYAVVLPNVRGSTGYGKTFVSLDNGMKREDSVKDIGALLDYMKARPREFDSTKVVAYGGSYGGYMVYAVMQHYPDRFAGGVDIVGISNWITFLENTSGYRRDLRRVEYGDERDPAMRAFLQKISPLSRADQIKKPMFIVQGFNDPRVPYTEAEQMLAALKKNGVAPWFMMAKDEGHGFAKKANQEAQREAETLFFEQILRAK